MSVLIRAFECFVLAVFFGLLPFGIGFVLGRIIKLDRTLDRIKDEIKEIATYDAVDTLVEVAKIIDKYRGGKK